MNFFSKVRGTIESIFRIGLGGPQLKNNAGIIEARTATDAAFEVVRGADPTTDDDLATKRYVDAHVPPPPPGTPPAILTWQPGGVTGGSVFANWADVLTKLAAVEMNAILVVDSSLGSATVPGTTQIDGLGRLQIFGSGINATDLTFANGAQIKNVIAWSGLFVIGTPTVRSPILYDISEISPNAFGTLFQIGAGATLALIEIGVDVVNMGLFDNSFIANNSNGLPVIHVNDAIFADLELQVASNGKTVAAVQWDRLISGGANATLDLRLDAGFDPAITAGGGGILSAFLGTFAVFQTDFAQGVGYTPDKPNFWAAPAPTEEKNATDRLAAAVYALRGNVPIP